MPAASSADGTEKARMGMILWNAFPAAHVAAVVALAFVPPWSLGWRLLGSVLVLFVLPPLLARAVTARRPLEAGEHAMGSGTFAAWWAVACLQGVFNRLGFLEELLRLVPGLYSLWLRLWGARIGRLTFWAPRARILDRSLLIVGDDVVVGVGAQLASHLLVRRGTELRLLLGAIHVGDKAVIGGLSRIAPGVEIGADEATDACATLPPFNRFVGGRRVRARKEAADG